MKTNYRIRKKTHGDGSISYHAEYQIILNDDPVYIHEFFELMASKENMGVRNESAARNCIKEHKAFVARGMIVKEEIIPVP